MPIWTAISPNGRGRVEQRAGKSCVRPIEDAAEARHLAAMTCTQSESRHPGAGRDPVNMLREARLTPWFCALRAHTRLGPDLRRDDGQRWRGDPEILFRTRVRLRGNDEIQRWLGSWPRGKSN